MYNYILNLSIDNTFRKNLTKSVSQHHLLQQRLDQTPLQGLGIVVRSVIYQGVALSPCLALAWIE